MKIQKENILESLKIVEANLSQKSWFNEIQMESYLNDGYVFFETIVGGESVEFCVDFDFHVVWSNVFEKGDEFTPDYRDTENLEIFLDPTGTFCEFGEIDFNANDEDVRKVMSDLIKKELGI